MYKVQSKMYSVQCTKYNVKCAVYSIKYIQLIICTMYGKRNISPCHIHESLSQCNVRNKTVFAVHNVSFTTVVYSAKCKPLYIMYRIKIILQYRVFTK